MRTIQTVVFKEKATRRHQWFRISQMRLLAIAENTEQVEEEVDEVKVKRETTHQRQLHR